MEGSSRNVKQFLIKNALVRSILFWILFIALLFVAGNLSNMVSFEMPKLIYGLLGVAAAFFLIWIFLRTEKRSFTSVELSWRKNTLPKFFLGLLIGTVIMILIVLALSGFTDVHLSRNKNEIQPFTWLLYLLVYIPLAWMEELAFRSYTLLKLNTAYRLWWAQLISAIAFAFYHMAYGWSWHDAFLGTFVWAFVFGYAAIASNGIALPTGIHVALNFLQALLGFKPDKLSLLEFNLKNTGHAQSNLDRVGIFIQIFVLITALLCTALFIKRKQRRMQVVSSHPARKQL